MNIQKIQNLNENSTVDLKWTLFVNSKVDIFCQVHQYIQSKIQYILSIYQLILMLKRYFGEILCLKR